MPSPPLRVGFAGTPVFAAAALQSILDAGFAVPLVLTQPDRARGRGMLVESSPVKALAQRAGIPILQPATLKTDDARASVVQVPLDVLVVAAYGLLLPPAILNWPRHGCINIHASLLPRWRGAAPIPRAIAAGDTTSGVTIMQMDVGLDTGPMITTVSVALSPRDTAGRLHDRLARAGADAIVVVLHRLAREGRLHAEPQPATGATYAAKLDRAEARIDWTLPAQTIDGCIRAFDPVPGAFTTWRDDAVKIWSAQPSAARAGVPPGTIFGVGSDGIDVACGEGVLRLVTVQPAGGKRMDAAAFAAGRALRPGTRFGAID
ncbi:MAG: methionyl-tRNA formyltransferase [Betaproteobacteria bacterium]